MKKTNSTILTLALFSGILIDTAAQEPPNIPGRGRGGSPTTKADNQTKFDLNFKGGTPKQFIETINAQSGLEPLIVPGPRRANPGLRSSTVLPARAR